ncbi:unnamed protein product [Ectocarpus sp. 6 AP-2014]|uniref:Enhancer of rudimentary homolog n=1 Tax=Ectocarpus siliculosus TaxID=2880 RepID=D7FUP2_ECTSI|nr:conserved unknown protein [Ectocarpus siliculosus]|eukprot:CBJ31686.1 conserved unknown protein [Ectocarpus siliculosus]
MGYHTILLVQRDSVNSRMYYDLPSTSQAMERVVKMYEARLKEVNPRQVHITYDITDLYGFIDELGDLSALVANTDTGMYTPHGKAWIKEYLFKYFQQQAET